MSGEITVRGHGGGGPFRVTNVSGDVRLADIGSDLELETVTGDMDVRMDELRRARIKTTNGDLELTARLAKDARSKPRRSTAISRMLFAAPVECRVRHRDLQRRHRQLLRPEAAPNARICARQ